MHVKIKNIPASTPNIIFMQNQGAEAGPARLSSLSDLGGFIRLGLPLGGVLGYFFIVFNSNNKFVIIFTVLITVINILIIITIIIIIMHRLPYDCSNHCFHICKCPIRLQRRMPAAALHSLLDWQTLAVLSKVYDLNLL